MSLDVANRIVGLFGGLRTKSKFALETALRARELQGVEGVLVIVLPSDNKQPAEVHFTTGRPDIVSDLRRAV